MVTSKFDLKQAWILASEIEKFPAKKWDMFKEVWFTRDMKLKKTFNLPLSSNSEAFGHHN